MKYFLLTFISALSLSAVYSQKNTAVNPYVVKFINYYNSGKTDSIYTLLADEVKSAMPVSTLNVALLQVKGALGNLIKSEYFKGDNNADSYITTFERSGPVLYLNYNKANKLIGFYVNADQRELPGTVTVKTASSLLKGTLSVPDMATKIPVILLIAGSGPTDRDGNSLLLKGKPNYFLEISNALKLKNIAVLRYDKRLVGQSTSTKTEAGILFDDMVDDAIAFIKLLKTDARFSKVIVAGHSEGSLVGIIACEREKADAFISLSGAGLPIDAILKTQIKENYSPANYAKVALMIDSIKAGKLLKQKIDPDFEGLFRTSVQPYLHSWMMYDPKEEISKLTIPVLIIQGTNDIQVGVINEQQLKKGKPDSQLKIIEGMSHILKEAPVNKEQNAATYTMSDLPLHPKLISTLTEFVNSLK